ncbi:MAG: molybdopterin molybdotransferase MoeA [Micromonosporaceae bacterium]
MTLTAPEWRAARAEAHRVGAQAQREATPVALSDADGAVLAEPLVTLTDLPAFPTSSVDGFAVRGAGPWRIVGQVLAGSVPPPLRDGEAMEIATGAMTPEGIEQLIRVEHSETPTPGHVTGQPRARRDWRDAGEEASKGEVLAPSGTLVTPGLIGLAASCGYDELVIRRRPTAAVLVFGDELAVSGPPGEGRVRDSLGPSMPAWLRRLGAAPASGFAPLGPVEDTLQAHVSAIQSALDAADLVCTTGGTMHGPVDHLHPALAELGAEYVINTVRARPGFPMLLARIPARDGRPVRWVAGLPGNPQSAVVALVSLVTPLLAGLAGRPLPTLQRVRLGAAVEGRGDHTHLALVRIDPDGVAYPLPHAGSAMLRGVAGADGFAVINPNTSGAAGDVVDLAPLPLRAGELGAGERLDADLK